MTSNQGLGGVRAERPGGYAELVTVAASASAPIPADLDSHDMAALGLASVTALERFRRLGPLTGRRILLTGASGGRRSSAIRPAPALGAQQGAGARRTRRRAPT